MPKRKFSEIDDTPKVFITKIPFEESEFTLAIKEAEALNKEQGPCVRTPFKKPQPTCDIGHYLTSVVHYNTLMLTASLLSPNCEFTDFGFDIAVQHEEPSIRILNGTTCMKGRVEDNIYSKGKDVFIRGNAKLWLLPCGVNSILSARCIVITEKDLPNINYIVYNKVYPILFRLVQHMLKGVFYITFADATCLQ